MALFLVQHGLSLSKEEHPERGLSEAGKEDTSRIADVAKHYAIPVRKIVSSGKKRAKETAAFFQSALKPEAGVETISGINPLDDVNVYAKTIDSEANVMVVGHLPFMEKLVGYLTTGSEETLVYRFQNSGIVCLDRDDDGWYIKWTLNPNIG